MSDKFAVVIYGNKKPSIPIRRSFLILKFKIQIFVHDLSCTPKTLNVNLMYIRRSEDVYVLRPGGKKETFSYPLNPFYMIDNAVEF